MSTRGFEWEIGWRYVRAGRAGHRNGFVSFLSFISMIGIALGVAALIVVLSVMNGFQKVVRERMLSVVPHVELIDSGGRALADWRRVADAARQDPAVRGAAPFVAGESLLARGDEMRGVVIRGVLPEQEAQVTPLAASLATLTPGARHIVLGSALAQALHAKVGDRVTLAAPGEGAPGAAPRWLPFTVSGTFSSGHFQFDNLFAMLALDDAAEIQRTGGPTAVRLALADPLRAPEVADALRARLGPGLIVRDWTSTNRSWFESVQIQKRMMAIILVLIVAVAAFNLVSTLVMGVTDKRADIAILRTLGCSPRSISAIFVVQGAVAGFVGTAAGAALGLVIGYNLDVIVPAIEHLLGRVLIDPSVYLIDRMPSDPQAGDVLPIVAVSLVLAFLATLYPSWRAGRVDPAEALRYE